MDPDRSSSPAARLARVALVGVMVAGSIAMWVGNPLLWLWVAARVADSASPAMTPIVVFLAGVAITMVPLGLALVRVDRLHRRLAGTEDTVRRHKPWMRSMRAERSDAGRGSVLEVVMVASVTVVLVALGIWFLLFAGSPAAAHVASETFTSSPR